MTQEQASANSQDKLKAIETLCKQLQVSVSAEQILTKEGFIKHIVFYTDNEKYDIQEAKTEETTDLRKENVKDKFRIRPSVVGGSEGEKDRTHPGDIC